LNLGYNLLAKRLLEFNYKNVFDNLESDLTVHKKRESLTVVTIPNSIQYIMSSIALIDSCCEGENEFVINISQKTLSIE
jgi:hypothetical protein